MPDLPINSISPNVTLPDPTPFQAFSDDPVLQPLNNTSSDDTPIYPAPIQIDLKTSYKNKQSTPVAAPSYSSGGKSPFGAPSIPEMYEDSFEDSPEQHVETIVAPEIISSPEHLQPEQAPKASTDAKEPEKVQELVATHVVDLQKPVASPPKKKKKEIAPTASKLTLAANAKKEKFIQSILGAHAD